jgi:hypothetical protein
MLFGPVAKICLCPSSLVVASQKRTTWHPRSSRGNLNLKLFFIVRDCRDIIHQIIHFPDFSWLLLLPVSWFGWHFTYVRGRLCADLHENTMVTCVWMRLTFLNAFLPARRQLRNETWGIAGKCSTCQCQSNAPNFDDIRGCLHTTRKP